MFMCHVLHCWNAVFYRFTMFFCLLFRATECRLTCFRIAQNYRKKKKQIPLGWFCASSNPENGDTATNVEGCN